MKYELIVEEVISDVFHVEAKSEEEAVNKAIKKYKSGSITLEPGNLEHKQIALCKPNINDLKWIEF